MHYPKTAFIGAGNMSTAIISGLIENNYPAEKIIASNPSAGKLNRLSRQFSINTTQDNCQAAKNADVIILAIKPSVIQSVCEQIATSVDQQLILSIAAGKTTATIKKYLQNNMPVIRAMPNTPCLLSKGIIGLFAEPQVPQKDKDFVVSLFENIGKIIWLDTEKQIDIVTALSGSGPAYYFYLTEALMQAGINLGLEESTCKTLVEQTAIGSIAMLHNPPIKTIQELRKAVTSPGGTTETAIKVFDENDLMQTISDAIKSATNRAREMSKY